MRDDARVRKLCDAGTRRGDFVLYWMQQAQRAESNHALEFAIGRANALHQPLVVFFGATPRFPHASADHYRFMFEGLSETAEAVEERGASFLAQAISPVKGVLALAPRASEIVVDRGYLRIQRQWREQAAWRADCPMYEVESDVVVPVTAAMQKQAYSAAVLRPRIGRLLPAFLVPVRKGRVKAPRIRLHAASLDLKDMDGLLRMLKVAKGPGYSRAPEGGRKAALRLLRSFVREKLDAYAEDRNDPNLDATSHLSPYLHFGQISALEIALAVAKTKSQGKVAFLEELIVRRELAMNYVSFNPHYDVYAGVPAWARKTLALQENDRREYVYTLKDLECARTHDPYWNAAQREMMLTGRMHGYMRMYWGKKVIEWTRNPREAFEILVALNDRYEMDGRDPNGYAGIAWCFGAHDRPWAGRKIFGNVRFMNAAGLKRKFDADAYVERIAALGRSRPRGS